jgi:hypothetical protein
MKKRNKQLTYLLVGLVVSGLIAFAFYLGVQQSVLGVSETIEYGDSQFDFDDGVAGTGIAEGYVTLPSNTSLFAFSVDYNLKTIYKVTTQGRANIKYEIFNVASNSWETIHDKSWSIAGCSTCTNEIDFDGDSVYQAGIPEHLVIDLVSSGTYDKYFGCLNGMSVEEAQQLNFWIEGTSTYRYYCMYPDTYQKEYDYRDASDNYDLEYFPPLITKDKNYINSDNKVKFRITYNAISGLRSKDQSDFRIHLWNVETPKINVWTFENETCNKYERYTYQTQTTDYFTENECKTANNLTVIISPPITGGATNDVNCDPAIMSCETDQFDKTSINYVKWIIIGVTILILLFIFILIKKRMHKRRK